jgi:hypothetical protein
VVEKESNLTALVEASRELREWAYPERGKRALLKLSAHLTWSYRHIKAVYYEEAGTVVDADEMKELKRRRKLAQQETEATDDIAQLRAEIAFIKDRLRRMDPDFYEPTTQALRVVSREYERKTNEPQ